MSEEMRKIFAENLRYWLHERHKTQADMCKYMDISSATGSDWANGKKMPRADKLQSLANWLLIDLTDLMSERRADQNIGQVPVYYDGVDEAAAAQDLKDHYGILLDADPKVRKAVLDAALTMYLAMKDTNPNG